MQSHIVSEEGNKVKLELYKNTRNEANLKPNI